MAVMVGDKQAAFVVEMRDLELLEKANRATLWTRLCFDST